MKRVIGALMILGGVALGFYVGLWLCFIGGIVAIINEIKSPEAVDAITIALGIVRIVGAGLAGGLSAIMLMAPGAILMED